MVQYIGVGVLSQMVVVLPQKGGRFPDFCAKFIKSFYFYDIIYFAMKISVYHEFEVCLVMDQFQGFQPLVIKIWACILRVGVLSHVTLSANPRYGYFTLMAEWQVSVTLWGCRNELSKTCGWPVGFNFFNTIQLAFSNWPIYLVSKIMEADWPKDVSGMRPVSTAILAYLLHEKHAGLIGIYYPLICFLWMGIPAFYTSFVHSLGMITKPAFAVILLPFLCTLNHLNWLCHFSPKLPFVANIWRHYKTPITPINSLSWLPIVIYIYTYSTS